MENSVFLSDLFIMLIGVPSTFLIWILFFILNKFFISKKKVILNSNLAKIGFYWSEKLSKPVQLSSSIESHSISHHYLIIGFLLSFLSWFGFLISIIFINVLMFSYSREERKYFHSQLISNSNLTQDEVNNICAQISNDS